MAKRKYGDNLAGLVDYWLDEKVGQAKKMVKASEQMVELESNVHTRGQLTYAQSLLAGLKWVQSQIPAEWSSYAMPELTDHKDVPAAPKKSRQRTGTKRSSANTEPTSEKPAVTSSGNSE